MRLQAGRQQVPDVDAFRRRTKTTLQEIERAAAAAGYDGSDVRDTHFAVVAFLDSIMLRMNDAIRHEWERKTLQEELFGQTDAGVVFFEKLDQFRSRRDSAQVADILEVYLLCLLLGFEGRYSGPLRGELDGVMERIKGRIELIRGPRRTLSPCGGVPAGTTAEAPVPRRAPERLPLYAAGAALLTLACFAAFKLNLIWYLEQLRGKAF
ncbi:MAG: DotU family type IV/VI secretion system protein [Acidobacteriia bacterium]|nr:DotU family type IV/VI secretion system protein [Terriglobia bacterium]